MRATISGQAGLAAVQYGSTIQLYSIDSESWESFAAGQVATLFDGATDVVSVEVADRNEAVCSMSMAWTSDRLLQMLLILLRHDADLETRREAAEVAETFINIQPARRFARNRLHSRPLPEDADIGTAIAIARFESRNEIAEMLTELHDHQVAIAELAGAWDNIVSQWPDRRLAGRIRRTLEQRDVWYRLAAASNWTALNTAIADALADRTTFDLPNIHEVLNQLAGIAGARL